MCTRICFECGTKTIALISHINGNHFEKKLKDKKYIRDHSFCMFDMRASVKDIDLVKDLKAKNGFAPLKDVIKYMQDHGIKVFSNKSS